MASCIFQSILIPDSHSVACGRTKRFFRVYCKFSLPPLVYFSRVEGDRGSSQGCGCGYIYKNMMWQRGFRQLQSMYVARLPKRPAFLHFFGTLRASKCSSSHHCHLSTLSIYHSRLGTDRQDEDEDQQIRYVINRLVQKLFRDYRHNRYKTTPSRNRKTEINDEAITIVRGITQSVYAEDLAKVRRKSKKQKYT